MLIFVHSNTVFILFNLLQCQFCFEDVSATVVRVGKYFAECKTREAVETLYKQFNKFIESTVPQQEEKFQQIIDLAEQLYGKDLSSNIGEKKNLRNITYSCSGQKEADFEICWLKNKTFHKVKTAKVIEYRLENVKDFRESNKKNKNTKVLSSLVLLGFPYGVCRLCSPCNLNMINIYEFGIKASWLMITCSRLNLWSQSITESQYVKELCINDGWIFSVTS